MKQRDQEVHQILLEWLSCNPPAELLTLKAVATLAQCGDPIGVLMDCVPFLNDKLSRHHLFQSYILTNVPYTFRSLAILAKEDAHAFLSILQKHRPDLVLAWLAADVVALLNNATPRAETEDAR